MSFYMHMYMYMCEYYMLCVSYVCIYIYILVLNSVYIYIQGYEHLYTHYSTCIHRYVIYLIPQKLGQGASLSFAAEGVVKFAQVVGVFPGPKFDDAEGGSALDQSQLSGMNFTMNDGG